MALVRVNAEIRVGHIVGGLFNIARLDTRRVFKKMRPLLYADQRDHRLKQMGPSGRRWPALAKSTVERRARMGVLRNRRLLGRLPGATRNLVNRRSLSILSRVRWSLAHQNGPTRVGRGSVLPQRQYYWVSKKMERTARWMFIDAMIRSWLGLPI